MREIVVAGGGTGGHLFPGLAVADALRAAGMPVSWLGARRGLEATRVAAAGIPIRLLSVTGAVGRGRAAQAGAVGRLLPAALLAAMWLLRRDAGAVLSVGGYAALPGALAAGLVGVPLVIQEQNALPGTTNRLLAPWSTAIACGFPAAVPAFAGQPAKWTGNPVRSEFFAVAEPPAGPPTLLVTGGSQGATILNRTVPDALARLAAQGIRPAVLHQTGPRWHDEVGARYAELGLAAETTAFLERPWEALGRATVVVARAGALTVTEIAAAGRFALLVPFAAAAHGHQLVNAQALANLGAAEIVEEHAATPDLIADRIGDLIRNPERTRRNGMSGRGLANRDAAFEVAALVAQRAGAVGPVPAWFGATGGAA